MPQAAAGPVIGIHVPNTTSVSLTPGTCSWVAGAQPAARITATRMATRATIAACCLATADLLLSITGLTRLGSGYPQMTQITQMWRQLPGVLCVHLRHLRIETVHRVTPVNQGFRVPGRGPRATSWQPNVL